MSSVGIVGVSAYGDPDQASPSIWSDCPNTLLNDKSLGAFIDVQFRGVPADPGINADADTGTTYTQAATATYGPHVAAVLNTNTDNNAVALTSGALGQIIRNSGKPFWAEARIAPGALGDSAFFFGLTTLANATRDVIADNPSNSAVAGLTAASVIGFVTVQATSALATVNAVYSKATAAPVTVLANVTNATALTASGVGTSGNLVANAFRKYGVRFDGLHTVYFYVDGVVVAKQDLDSTFDQTSYYTVVFNQKTGAATQIINYVDFIRGGAKVRT